MGLIMNRISKLIVTLFAVGGAGLLTARAHAAPLTFFGEDTNGGSAATSHPVADAARATFLAGLNGVGTEAFESFSGGSTAPLNLSFPGAGTATLTGNGSIFEYTQGGRFATSGSKYFSVESGNFTVSFSSPIAAFGFYGTDIGDGGQSLSLILTGSDGTITTLDVPNVVDGTLANGSVLFYGFRDSTSSYTSVTFAGAGGSNGGDVFGFDDLTVGSARQVTAVPSPIAGAGLIPLAGFGAAWFGRRRRERRTS